jgi:hypothetical protein
MKLSPDRSSTLIALCAVVSKVVAQEWKDANVHKVLFPYNAPETDEQESFECVAANLTQYFDPPLPSDELNDEFMDYANPIINDCIEDDGVWETCFPGKDTWCSFTTLAPPSLSSDLSSFASAADSWWSAKSVSALIFANDCPNAWWLANYAIPGSRQATNLTVMFAQCNKEWQGPNNPGDTATTSVTSLLSTAAPASRTDGSGPRATAVLPV